MAFHAADQEGLREGEDTTWTVEQAAELHHELLDAPPIRQGLADLLQGVMANVQKACYTQTAREGEALALEGAEDVAVDAIARAGAAAMVANMLVGGWPSAVQLQVAARIAGWAGRVGLGHATEAAVAPQAPDLRLRRRNRGP